jgi:hypothetical protein
VLTGFSPYHRNQRRHLHEGRLKPLLIRIDEWGTKGRSAERSTLAGSFFNAVTLRGGSGLAKCFFEPVYCDIIY